MNKYFLALALVVTTCNSVQSSDVDPRFDFQLMMNSGRTVANVAKTVSMIARGFDILAKGSLTCACVGTMAYNETVATCQHPERPYNPMSLDEKIARAVTYAAVPCALACNKVNDETLACASLVVGAAASSWRYMAAVNRTKNNDFMEKRSREDKN